VSGDWTTNADVEQLASAIRNAGSIAVLTHTKPDGDAIGSTFAVARSAMAAGAENVEVWLVGPVPRWVKSLSSGLTVREFAPGSAYAAPSSPDLRVVVDTGSWSQLAESKSVLTGQAAKTVLIDHHLHGDSEVADRRYIQTSCASCTQVLAPLCVALTGSGSAARLPQAIAEMLYLGLATDTGWFRYSNVTPATMRLAADLMEAGVDHTRLYRLIEQQDVPARWKLLGRALNTLEVSVDGRVATVSLTDQDFVETGGDRNDTGGFADMLLTIASVQVSGVLIANPKKPGETELTKISLRSKPGDQAVDVNAVANRIGGGGHARAAGAKINAGIDEAKRILLKELTAALAANGQQS
jgi:phosphoesterase RecJ-like protein